MKTYKSALKISIAISLLIIGFIAYHLVSSSLSRDKLTIQIIAANDVNEAAFKLLSMEFVGVNLADLQLKILALKRENSIEDESFDKDTYWVWNQILFHYANGRVTKITAWNDF